MFLVLHTRNVIRDFFFLHLLLLTFFSSKKTSEHHQIVVEILKWPCPAVVAWLLLIWWDTRSKNSLSLSLSPFGGSSTSKGLNTRERARSHGQKVAPVTSEGRKRIRQSWVARNTSNFQGEAKKKKGYTPSPCQRWPVWQSSGCNNFRVWTRLFRTATQIWPLDLSTSNQIIRDRHINITGLFSTCTENPTHSETELSMRTRTWTHTSSWF